MPRPILISGIQPTGRLHIGNYLGALKNFVDLQNSGKYQCYFFIADLHALTENPSADDLAVNIKMLAADFLAAGLNTKKSILFQQSQVSAHSELAWIFNTITPMGELARMTQFKDKSGTTRTQVVDSGIVVPTIPNVGLFDYPVLMAADILLYSASVVPTGNDQDQHLELARTLARKFNTKSGKTFIEPKNLHTATPRVMSLDNPEKKMSKSFPGGCLFIDDSPEEIKSKVSRAVTDSGSEIKHDVKKPGVSNLLEIYSGLSGTLIQTLEKKFAGKGYGEFKKSLAKLVATHFADFREKKKSLIAKPKELAQTLRRGSGQASLVASKKIAEVKKKIGLSV